MRAILWLSAAGVAFAGVLSILYYQGLCGGGCTPLLGVPSCIYGLVLFLALLVGALLAPRHEHALLWIFGVACLGIVFSLGMVIKEMLVCTLCYPLLLPNCAYGLLVFCAIAGLAFHKMKL